MLLTNLMTNLFLVSLLDIPPIPKAINSIIQVLAKSLLLDMFKSMNIYFHDKLPLPLKLPNQQTQQQTYQLSLSYHLLKLLPQTLPSIYITPILLHLHSPIYIQHNLPCLTLPPINQFHLFSSQTIKIPLLHQQYFLLLFHFPYKHPMVTPSQTGNLKPKKILDLHVSTTHHRSH